MARQQDKQIEEKSKEIQTLQKEIEKEKALIYAEVGGQDADDIVNEKIQQKKSDIMKKVDKK